MSFMENEEKFSDDPEEQLRIENELLKLKMQAELGALFGDNKDLPPEVEQEFLKQVQAFHEQQQHAPLIKVKDYVQINDLPDAKDLPDEAITLAWASLEQQLLEKQLQVVFDDTVDDRARYDFVVSELFELEIMKPADGANWIFDYEEFHPNPAKDMSRRTEEFITAFFENSIDEKSWFLATPLITPAGKTMTIKSFLEKIQLFHDLFLTIKSYDYKIEDTHLEAPDEGAEQSTRAVVEGAVRYTVETEMQEEQEVFGPFRLAFQCTHGWWEIYGCTIQGFSMD